MGRTDRLSRSSVTPFLQQRCVGRDRPFHSDFSGPMCVLKSLPSNSNEKLSRSLAGFVNYILLAFGRNEHGEWAGIKLTELSLPTKYSQRTSGHCMNWKDSSMSWLSAHGLSGMWSYKQRDTAAVMLLEERECRKYIRNNNWTKEYSCQREIANLFKPNGALYNVVLSAHHCDLHPYTPPSSPKCTLSFPEHIATAS